jgi:glycosyltransferase involved in cell wall biosynthesis
MNILVVTPNFSIAGVPLAQIRFARALSARGHSVTLMIGHVVEGYDLPEIPEIKVVLLQRSPTRLMLVPICRYLRKFKPDVVFSAEDHLNALVLMAAVVTRSKAKISCSSRVTPFDTYSDIPFSKRWVLKQLMRSVMWRANVLSCVSKDMVHQYRKVFSRPKHVCIYNIVDDVASRRRMLESVNHDWLDGHRPALVAAGRLASWKGFSDLILAMPMVREHSDARLLILGDGPLRGELQQLVDDLQLQDCVRLEGYVENPLKFFAKSDVFVLSSLVEGLPNVLVEAMLCGCTPVSTDCPTGPRELLGEGKFGYLVPVHDPEAMAGAILKALAAPASDASLREAIGPFNEEVVIDRHFELLGFREHMTCEGLI